MSFIGGSFGLFFTLFQSIYIGVIISLLVSLWFFEIKNDFVTVQSVIYYTVALFIERKL